MQVLRAPITNLCTQSNRRSSLVCVSLDQFGAQLREETLGRVTHPAEDLQGGGFDNEVVHLQIERSTLEFLRMNGS